MKKKTLAPKKAPFFSVIVPLYNKGPYVRRTLESILGQTFRDFEVVVVDDGSTDDGGKVLSSIKDRRIRVITQPNAGVSAARNRGVAAARGAFMAFLDADDEWEAGFLEALHGLIRDFPGAGLYSTNFSSRDGERIWENQVQPPPGWRGRLGNFFRMAKGDQIPIHTGSVCLPADLARQIPFPAGIKGGEDLYVWFQACLKHDMAYLNQPLSIWNQQTEENAHRHYFGPQYHLDWLALEDRLRREKALSGDAARFLTLVALIQTKKMILEGQRGRALAQWWRCPKTHFPLKQAGLLFLAFSPLGFYKTSREFYRRFSGPRVPGQGKGLGPESITVPPALSLKNSPFFSIIVPVYNKKDYIQRSLGSVRAQSFRDFEVIVVDDGSKDGSPGIVRSLKDKRIRLIVQKNAGVSAARNQGVSAARGKYVAFLDADDDWSPGYLEALKGLIADFPGAGLYGTNYWIDNGLEKVENPVRLPPGWRGRMRDYYGLVYYGRPPFCTNTVCLPASLAKQNPFPPGIKAGEDLLVWFKVSLKHDTVYLHQPLSTYYVEASENTHKVYFGPQYHLDWLELGRRLKEENLLSRSGEKYVVWATLIQTRKMIANGHRRAALAKWWRCPKTYFPLYQAALFAMFFIPLKQRKSLRPVFSRGPVRAPGPGKN